MKARRVVALGAVVTVADAVFALLAGVLASGASVPAAQFTDEGVTVTLRLMPRSAAGSGRAIVATTFTPQQPGFHLYSTALPADGIGGVGRPTKVELGDGVLVGAGPLAAESPVRPLTLIGTDLTLPVYPDGPVTVDLPVVVTSHGRARVSVSYASCSETACRPPVIDHVAEFAVGS